MNLDNCHAVKSNYNLAGGRMCDKFRGKIKSTFHYQLNHTCLFLANFAVEQKQFAEWSTSTIAVIFISSDVWNELQPAKGVLKIKLKEKHPPFVELQPDKVNTLGRHFPQFSLY